MNESTDPNLERNCSVNTKMRSERVMKNLLGGLLASFRINKRGLLTISTKLRLLFKQARKKTTVAIKFQSSIVKNLEEWYKFQCTLAIKRTVCQRTTTTTEKE
ncbi:hypothetical protein AVEN_269131-1 [Araneus ventricosus]|uniref:Uncharacterized protein n=1 Tax=Araneus ventricosus TaxID=182803 RepID=A0A4Y2GZY2_ARAVE|nr:hypothetical protein AVEN_269131-1 [Araneus ventricosus]